MRRAAAGDYAFLDLTRSAFDLSDRGVEGRPAPGPLDVFITPERGIYRPGETMHLTALVRDPRADAVGDLPLTLVVERPDGVEYLRRTISDGGLGGYSSDVALEPNAMRGSWRARLYADPKGASLAEVSVLVEDFEPERLAFELTTDAKAIGVAAPVDRRSHGALSLRRDGAEPLHRRRHRPPAGRRHRRLPGIQVRPRRGNDRSASASRSSFDAVTDEDGKATLEIGLPQLPASTKPFRADILVRLADTNGRAVERKLSLPVTTPGEHIGIKPLFDEDVEEGSNAEFEVILVGPDGKQIAGSRPRLEARTPRDRLPVVPLQRQLELRAGRRRPSASPPATIDVAADRPTDVAVPVDWGSYRFTVETAGDQPTATSVEFYAGWYVSAASTETPDVLRVALDKPAYRIGETAKLRLDPRFAGIALVTVIDDRLVSMKAVEVPAEGTTVDLEVTEEWGPGAYVTAALYRPMDVEAKRMPARALGLTWAKVDPGDRDLDVVLDAARGDAAARTDDDSRGDRQSPARDRGLRHRRCGRCRHPQPHQLQAAGSRRLVFRPAQARHGDPRPLRLAHRPDAGRAGRRCAPAATAACRGSLSPPPTEKLVAFYSGIVRVDPDGKATVSFDMPEFNGTVRVMAMAWSQAGVGHAAKDVIVRDPVVVSASLPRFLASGDKSRLLVEINNVAGPAGDYKLSVGAGEGIGMADERRRTDRDARREGADELHHPDQRRPRSATYAVSRQPDLADAARPGRRS